MLPKPVLPTPRQIAAEVILDLALLAAFGVSFWTASTAQTWLLALSASVLTGFLSIQIILIFHDCMHESLFGPSPIARAAHRSLGRLIGGFAFFPFHFIRASHLSHHRRAGLIEGDFEHLDPSLETAQSQWQGVRLARLNHSRLAPWLYPPYLQAAHFARWIQGGLPELSAKPGLKRAVAWDLLAMAGVWTLILLALSARGNVLQGIALGYLLPLSIGMSATFLASNPLHGLTAAYRLPDLGYVDRQFFVARTIESSRWIQLVFCNLNFHLEHHLHPGVSRWRLRTHALRLRPALRAHAKERNLPLLVHRSYRDWYRQRGERAYNPSVDRETFERAQSRFSNSDLSP